MSTPSVFISSTFYDLRHVREALSMFVEEIGYNPMLFEKGGIGFDYQKPLDESCYEAVSKCEIFVLIIGGRYGSPASEKEVGNKVKKYNSVTKKEYMKARECNIPINIFIDSAVISEYRTFQNNRKNKNVEYAHVDNTKIFDLIDDIYKQEMNNYVKSFSSIEDIIKTLKIQWASMITDFVRIKF